jgi:hypothetical protein
MNAIGSHMRHKATHINLITSRVSVLFNTHLRRLAVWLGRVVEKPLL